MKGVFCNFRRPRKKTYCVCKTHSLGISWKSKSLEMGYLFIWCLVNLWLFQPKNTHIYVSRGSCSAQRGTVLPWKVCQEILLHTHTHPLFTVTFTQCRFRPGYSASMQQFTWGFLGASAGKESACNEGDLGRIPGLGRSPGEGKGYHSSILAWRIPWTVWSMESQRVGQD